MTTPLMTDNFQGILDCLDIIISRSSLASILLELESLLGHLTIYETLHHTSSSGMVGLVQTDYPPRPQFGSAAVVVDDLPLLSLIEKVGGFALLLACHFRGISSPYATLILPSSSSRDATTIIVRVLRRAEITACWRQRCL
jgi:hypothetical protein